MAKRDLGEFKFRKHDNVGSESAESDSNFRRDCYYDIGDLAVLSDCSCPKCIILGRTGSGKSALLLRLEEEVEHPVRIEPEDLSLQYLSNSTILPQLEAMGVSLGLFYKLLWKHVFAVELIKARFSLRTEEETKTFKAWFWGNAKNDRQKERSIEYLTKWGEEFWKDTEYRVKEVTSKLESDVKSSLGAKAAGIAEISASGEAKISVEEKGDLVKRLQEVVDAIQVQQLTAVIRMLGESVFSAAQPRYYILIDKLDENWVDDRFRYRLMKALVQVAEEINKNLLSVKIVIAIRQDLLDMVIQQTRDTGFQTEKYEQLSVSLKWKQPQLLGMLEAIP
jgi:hypothetical protein